MCDTYFGGRVCRPNTGEMWDDTRGRCASCGSGGRPTRFHGAASLQEEAGQRQAWSTPPHGPLFILVSGFRVSCDVFDQ